MLELFPHPISIHAPHEGSDQMVGRGLRLYPGFQSTLPMRGATSSGYTITPASSRISIHAPHEGSDQRVGVSRGISVISIHAPHEGSDPAGGASSRCIQNFNPRSP